MSLIKKQFDILVSSNPVLGANNVRNNGGTFTVNFEDNGLDIPKNAENVSLQVINSELWYNEPNVITGVNDQLDFSYQETGGVLVESTITFDEGLYLVDDIQLALERKVSDLVVAGTLTNNIFKDGKLRIQFGADNPRSRVSLDFTIDGSNTYGMSCDFSSARSIGKLLGFTGTITALTTDTHFIGDQNPQFNTFNYYLLQSNIVSKGMRIGPTFDTIIAKILVQAKPNSQIMYSPTIPALIDASSLKGSNRRDYTFTLLDDKKNVINTRGEFWSAQIRISYDQPYMYGN